MLQKIKARDVVRALHGAGFRQSTVTLSGFKVTQIDKHRVTVIHTSAYPADDNSVELRSQYADALRDVGYAIAGTVAIVVTREDPS